MWYLQSNFDKSRKILILPGKNYEIGRRDCDIVIEYDQSVSKKHAIVSVSHSEASVSVSSQSSVNIRSSLVLTDVSKFGTYVNGEKIQERQILQVGDKIRFGSPKSVHKVVYEPLVVATSCLDSAGKKELRSLMGILGGHVSNDWSKECTLLVMKSVTVTIKVVCALVSLKPIVSVDYVRHLVEFYKGERDGQPKAEEYLPPVTESLLEPGVSFQVNRKRSSVFQGMSFYFLSSKQFHKMYMAVEEGGGVPILWETPQPDLEAFLEDKTVVMNPAASDLTTQPHRDWVDKVRNFLTKKGKYLVQDAEIGYAALYASTDTYCNADIDVTHLLPGAINSQALHTQNASLSSQMVSTQREGTLSVNKPAARKASVGLSLNQATQESADSRKSKAQKIQTKLGFTLRKTHVGETQMDETQEDSDFKKPKAVPSAVKRQSAATSGQREMGTRGKTATPPADQSVADTKDSKAFTVSESFTEEGCVQVKAERCEFNSQKASEMVVVKMEDKGDALAAQPSESLFSNTHSATTLEAVKKEEENGGGERERKPFLLLDDEDDDIVQTRKPPPSRTKRKIQKAIHEEEEDNEEDPFAFLNAKRPRKNTSPAPESREKTDSHPSSGQAASSPPASRLRSRSVSPVAKPDMEVVGDSLDEEEEEEENDDNPFDFDIGPGKKGRRTSPATGNKKGGRKRSPSPTPTAKKGKADAGGRRGRGRSSSPSPKKMAASTASQVEGRGDPYSELPAREKKTPETSSASKNTKTSTAENPAVRGKGSERGGEASSTTGERREDGDTSEGSGTISSSKKWSALPVPEGFLTTRRPLQDQVEVNPLFQPEENIHAPAMVVTFQDLVHHHNHRPNKTDTTTATSKTTTTTKSSEKGSVPEGMVRWKGKLVPNFKKFSKTLHAGAHRLPTIIGGRDLEEHCRASNKMMEDWLQDLTQKETETQRKDREAEKMFDFPAAKSRKGAGSRR